MVVFTNHATLKHFSRKRIPSLDQFHGSCCIKRLIMELGRVSENIEGGIFQRL